MMIKWKHLPRYWPSVRGIHRPVNFPHKGQWRGDLMFSLICAWINGWVNKGKTGDLSRHRAHYDVTVMLRIIHRVKSSSNGGMPHAIKRHCVTSWKKRGLTRPTRCHETSWPLWIPSFDQRDVFVKKSIVSLHLPFGWAQPGARTFLDTIITKKKRISGKQPREVLRWWSSAT